MAPTTTSASMDEKVGPVSDTEGNPTAATDAADLYIDPAAERKLLLKLDAFFVPVIMLVYLSCFLDRTNIGNVKIAGMPQDIGATTQEFSTAVSIFYATYVAFEAPWAIMMKKLTPRVLLTTLCIVWSLTTIFSGFITNIAGLYVARLVLGACEGGLFPGLNLYLTMVYKREEQAKRVSYLFVCTALSGAFGGLLAYVLLKMDGVAGYAGWRWVYIIEGAYLHLSTQYSTPVSDTMQRHLQYPHCIRGVVRSTLRPVQRLLPQRRGEAHDASARPAAGAVHGQRRVQLVRNPHRTEGSEALSQVSQTSPSPSPCRNQPTDSRPAVPYSSARISSSTASPPSCPPSSPPWATTACRRST